MAFEQLTNNLKGLTDNTQNYVETTAEYYKLSFFKHSMKGLVGMANLTARGVFGLIFMMFLSTGAAIWIGEQTGSYSTGFFVVGGFYFLIFVLIVAFARKPIEKVMLKKYSSMIYAEKDTANFNGLMTTKTAENEGVH